MNWLGRTLVVLSAAGIVVSSYLTLKSADPSAVSCAIGGQCEVVLSSKYAFIFGIPVSAFGMLWYLVLLGLIYYIYIKHQQQYALWLKVWALFGLVFSLYLLYIEAFILHAYCTWCVISLIIVCIIFILTWLPRRNNEQR